MEDLIFSLSFCGMMVGIKSSNLMLNNLWMMIKSFRVKRIDSVSKTDFFAKGIKFSKKECSP
jgi:hypothetical protein